MKNRRFSGLGLTLILCMTVLAVQARIPVTEKQRLIEGWEYLRGDLGGIWEAVRPVKPGQPEEKPFWTPVTLPHCFNAEDAVDPDVNYYQGPGWYRTYLDLGTPGRDGRLILEFEGAGQKTEVYVYTTLVGRHVGGYDSWSVDITDAVASFLASPAADRFEGRVPVSVRCDNTRDLEMIPSDLSDFNLYGGLYRYVNLIYLPPVSISSLAIVPELVESGQAGRIRVSARFYDPHGVGRADVNIAIKDPAGQPVAQTTLRDVVLSGEVELWRSEISDPEVWDVDTPLRYTCEVAVAARGQRTVAAEKFGFRSFEFEEQGPFRLNGRRLLLQGTHRHEDHAGAGAAMTQEQMEAEMTLMKRMGVNFIRLGHYQQSDIILDLCDSLGILVWEEIPWCRGGLGGASYREMARRMLTNMIEQHRNHPSVIIWGLGNENDWPGDFPEYDEAAIRGFMQELNDLAHDLDASRKTAIRRCAFCADIVDVYSPSIWAGWYRGVYQDYKPESEKEMKKVRHFLHVEWGGDHHTGRHAEDPYGELQKVRGGDGADERLGDASMIGGAPRVSRDGDWSETYVVKLIDWHLKEQLTMPWLTGSAYWPFKDFSTPIRPENPIPYVNQKGVVERDLTPKESYYVFQSYWTQKPMLHIYGHGWPVRWGNVGEQKEVLVYSNCPEVELYLNGKSQGVRERNAQDFPAAGLHWNIPFRPGQNTLRAVGRFAGREYVDEVSFEYQVEKWGPVADCEIRTEQLANGDVRIECQLVDAAGIRCLDARQYFYFSAAGDGRLIENLGTVGGSRKVQAANGRASIVVTDISGPVSVAVKVDGLPTRLVVLDK